MAREFLYLVQESAFKTPVGSPVVGTSSFYIRLEGGNAFKGRPKPVTKRVMYGGGLATPVYTVSDKQQIKLSLQTQLYGTQAALILPWCITRINAGQTLPWTTTEPAGDLASMSIYHAIQRSDASYKRRVYLGCKVDEWSLEAGEDSTTWMLNLSITAALAQGNQFDSSTDPSAGTFPAPTDAQLPVDPFLYVDSGGGISIASTRASCSRVKINSKHANSGKFYNNRYMQLYRHLGRQTMFEADNLYAASPDDRTAYEGLVSKSVSLAINNGTHSATFTLNAQNVFDSLEDNLPLEDLYFQNSSLANQYDNSAGADISVATT